MKQRRYIFGKTNYLYTSNLITNFMNSSIYIPLLSAVFTIFIGIYVLLISPKKITNRVFFVLVLLFTIFCISEFMTRISETRELALMWGRVCYSVLPLVSCVVVHFSLVFPRRHPNDNNIFTRYKYSLTALYLIGIILCIIFNMFVSIKDVQMSEWGFRVLLNNSTNFILYWFLVCGLYGTYAFFRTYHKRNVTINEKKQIKLMAIGFLLILILSLGTNAIPPLIGVSVFPMTTISLTLFSFIVAYSMIRYKLMKLTTIETADVVLDTMADSLIVVDENQTIVNVNKSSLNILGYARKELINSSLKNIVDLPRFESLIISKVKADGKVRDVETEFATKEGKKIPMNISASGIYDNNGKFEGIAIAARDLTETKNFIRQLEEAKTKLEERVNERTKELLESQRRIELQNIKLKKSNRIKSDFLNVTSHELRTPMAAMKGYIQMMMKQTLGDINNDQQKALEIILRNTNRLDELVQDILDISQLQSGNMKLIPEKTDVRKMLNQTIETLQPSAELKNIKINSDIEDNIHKLIIDKQRISQVLSNLVNNAIKFSPNDSIVNVRALEAKEEVLFEVQDSGRGIPKNKQKKVFDMFYQVDSGMDRKFGGVGLGLTISRSIIHTHGGRIWVDSNAEKGSTFKFTLPIKPVSDIERKLKDVDVFGLEFKE